MVSTYRTFGLYTGHFIKIETDCIEGNQKKNHKSDVRNYSVEKRIRYPHRGLSSAQMVVFFPLFCLVIKPLGSSEDFPSKFFLVNSTADKTEA